MSTKPEKGLPRLVGIALLGIAAVASALGVGSRQVGALPRGEDPVLARLASATVSLDPAQALVRSQELERTGDLAGAARAAAQAASAGSRDAALQAGKIAILRGSWAEAEGWLQPLVDRDGADVAARYNLALVAHYRGDSESARAGYRAVLAIDARHRDARYNLALLEWEAGARDQARALADALAVDFPADAGVLALRDRFAAEK